MLDRHASPPPDAGRATPPRSLPVLFPARPMISSRPLGWASVVVERFQFPAAEYGARPFPVHAVILQRGYSAGMQIQPGSFPTRQLAVVPAGLPNKCRHTEPTDALFVSVDPQFIKATAEHLDLDSGRVEVVNSVGTRDPRLEHIAQSLLQEVTSSELGGRLYVESLATQLAVHLLRHHSAVALPLPDSSEKGLSPAALGRVIAFINDQLSQDLSLAEIAASIHLSPYYFARLFKRSLGLPPHQYVIAQRVEAAKRLLAEGRLTTAQVAAQVGFADYSHLARHFKRLVGVPPAEFARACRPNLRR